MTTHGVFKGTTGLVTGALKLPIDLLRYAATEPLVTGSLFLALTQAPVQYRQKLLDLLTSSGLSSDRIVTLVKSLKYLFAIGVARRLNQALNKLALNNWHFRKPGVPFEFDGVKKSELVLITGGNSGFGYEMVKGFSKHARVIILDITPLPAELEAIPDVYYYQVNLEDFAAIETVAERIRHEHGDPSVLVNNAGVASGTSIVQSSAKLTERIFKVNIASHFILIKEFLPGMLRAKKGHIISIASMASFVSAPGLVDYCCTKVAALYLYEGLRSELQRFYKNGECIQVSCVHPFWHATGIVKPYEEELVKAGVRLDPPSNVSDAVIEQVFARRSGQIFMPRGEESKAIARSFPIWLQDCLVIPFRQSKKLEF